MTTRPEAADSVDSAPGRPVTSMDVARLAGVSRATVSNVLNGQVARFSAETVDRVRQAAATLGYVRSAAGRALVMGRSDLVVLVVSNVTLSNLQEVVEILTADLHALGFTLIVHFRGPGSPDASLARLSHMVEMLRPAGIISFGGLSAHDIAALERVGGFVVGHGRGDGLPDPGLESNRVIGRLQAQHLHERGYTALAYALLSDARDDPFGRPRVAGVEKVCAGHGLAPPARIDVPLDADGAKEALRPLVAMRGGRLGIACYSDEVGIALAFAALSLGVDVPRELGVIGLGGADFTQLVRPRLTTLRADLPATVRNIRQSIARDFGGAPGAPEPLSEDAFSVVRGDTT